MSVFLVLQYFQIVFPGIYGHLPFSFRFKSLHVKLRMKCPLVWVKVESKQSMLYDASVLTKTMDINKSMELSLYCFKILLPELNGSFLFYLSYAAILRQETFHALMKKIRQSYGLRMCSYFPSEKGWQDMRSDSSFFEIKTS